MPTEHTIRCQTYYKTKTYARCSIPTELPSCVQPLLVGEGESRELSEAGQQGWQFGFHKRKTTGFLFQNNLWLKICLKKKISSQKWPSLLSFIPSGGFSNLACLATLLFSYYYCTMASRRPNLNVVFVLCLSCILNGKWGQGQNFFSEGDGRGGVSFLISVARWSQKGSNWLLSSPETWTTLL